MASLKRQTMILTAANGVSRVMGFALRILMARLMAPEALGVMELAGSVSMLALTPVTAGLPTAVSRSAARRAKGEQEDVLRAGLFFVRRISLCLVPGLLVLSPLLAWLLGDMRALPAIAVASVSTLAVGACGVYGGYAMGLSQMQLPARNECIEQTLRCVLCGVLLVCFAGRSIALDAALPGVASAAAVLAAVFLYSAALPMDRPQRQPDPLLVRELYRLSAPMMVSRLCAAGLRMLNAVLLPLCLKRSGLAAAAATAQYGLLNGMAMPLIMAPCVVTGALSTVAIPAVSRMEGRSGLKPLAFRLIAAALGIGAASALALWVFAAPLGAGLFGQAALPPLIRVLCPLALLACLRQVQFGVIAGLGRQREALGATILSSAVTLVLTAWLAPMPRLRLYGASLAALAGQAAAVIWNSVLLRRALRADG